MYGYMAIRSDSDSGLSRMPIERSDAPPDHGNYIKELEDKYQAELNANGELECNLEELRAEYDELKSKYDRLYDTYSRIASRLSDAKRNIEAAISYTE